MQEVEQVALSCQFIYGSRKYGVKVGQGGGGGAAERVYKNAGCGERHMDMGTS